MTERASENVLLSVGAGIMILMLLYALGTELFGLDRPGSRVLFMVSLVIGAMASVARFVRLRRSGTNLLFLHPPATTHQDRAKYPLWICGAAILGAYSVYEVLTGGILVGTVGCIASVLSMFVLARGLVQPLR